MVCDICGESGVRQREGVAIKRTVAVTAFA